MNYIQRQLKQSGSEARTFLSDVFVASQRRLVLVFLGSALVIWLFLGVTFMTLLSVQYFGVVLALVAIGALLLRWPPRGFPVSPIICVLTLTLFITLTLVLYPNSAFKYAYMVIPFAAVVTIGWQAGLLSVLLIAGVMALLSLNAYLPPMSDPSNLVVLLGGVVIALISAAVVDVFYEATTWAVYYANQARAALDESRQHRQELLQVQEDLLVANQELGRLHKHASAMQQAAEEARQAKTEFVANVSHEFRAPLNMIIGFSEMITSSPRMYGIRIPPALLADIATIQRNAAHLSRLVDDVLDLSQIEVGRMAISKEAVQADALVTPVVEAMRPAYQSKSLYLEVAIPEGMPAVFCDPTRIRQILLNLLSNAVRFTTQGGVCVSVKSDNMQMIFSVADTGIGIAKEHQAKLFQPFQQVDASVRREHGGSGLGLNIAKYFVELHGGKIWLESEAGQGATISFSLPVVSDHPDVSPSTPSHRRWINPLAVREVRTRPFQAPVVSVVQPRWVIVETGAALTHLFSRYAENVALAKCDSVDDGLRELQRVPAQSLIVNTPALLNTTEAVAIAQQLSAAPDYVPSIVCWVPGREHMAREIGAIDYLVKPVTASQLLSAVGAVEEAGASIKKILVVDDDPDLLQLFTRILTTSPTAYQVWRAENAGEALEIIRERRPDLVLMDLGLPGTSGSQLLQAKRGDPTIRDIPVIIVSATDPLVAAGGADTLLIKRNKLFTGQELIHLVQAVTAVLSPQQLVLPSTDPESPAIHPS